MKYTWTYPSNETITTKNPRSYRFKEAGNYEISLTVTDPEGLSDTAGLQIEAKTKVKALTKSAKKSKSTKIPKKSGKTKFQNGNLSTQIKITEVFPNPKGKDTGKEWLELYNSGNQDINLGNWKISQTKLNSDTTKPKNITLSDQLTIKAKNYLILDNSQLKSLSNQQNKIELTDYTGKIIDSITYEKTTENLSLSKISIKNSENKNSSKQALTWTKPTKNHPNPVFYQIQGVITKTEADFFVLKTKLDKKIKIYFKSKSSKTDKYSSPNSSNQLNQTLLKESSQILALVEKTNNKPILVNYKIKDSQKTNKAEKDTNQTDSLLINLFKISCGIILTAALALLILPTLSRPSSSSHYK